MYQINPPFLYLNFETMGIRKRIHWFKAKSFLSLIKAKLKDLIYICKQWAFWYTSPGIKEIFKTGGMQEQNTYLYGQVCSQEDGMKNVQGYCINQAGLSWFLAHTQNVVQSALGMCLTCNSLPDSSWWSSQYLDCWGEVWQWWEGAGERLLRLVNGSDTPWLFPHYTEKNKPYGQVKPTR